MLISEISQLLQWSIFSGDAYPTGPYGSGHRFLKFRPNGHDIKVIFEVTTGEIREIVIFNDVFEPPVRWIQPEFRERQSNYAQDQRHWDPAYDELGYREIPYDYAMVRRLAELVPYTAVQP